MTHTVEKTAMISRLVNNHARSLATTFGVLRSNPGVVVKLMVEKAAHEEKLWMEAAEHTAGLRTEGFTDAQIFHVRVTP